jgi:hypothetical protein
MGALLREEVADREASLTRADNDDVQPISVGASQGQNPRA